ncbi:MAG: hypothetical protein AAF773_10185 [Cyanobacteria bacterium P01_D01_bin.115]
MAAHTASRREVVFCELLKPSLVKVLGVAEMKDEQIGGPLTLPGLAKTDLSQASATSDSIPTCRLLYLVTGGRQGDTPSFQRQAYTIL